MWKFKIQNVDIHRNWSLSNAISMIEKWEGTLLFTSPEHNKSHNIVLGINPISTISSDKGHTLADIDTIITTNEHIAHPFLFGHISYDAKHTIEEPGIYKDLQDNQFALFQFTIYQFVFIFTPSWELKNALELTSCNESKTVLIDQIEQFYSPESQQFSVSIEKSHPTKEEFIKGVKTIHNYIKAGDVYQVNLTRKVSATISGSATAAALALLESNRIEFGVFQKCGVRYLISTSPERFFQTNGLTILTSPIKGTAPTSPENDNAGTDLLNDEKNLRELAMITDLLRNDLSRICHPGTVTVKGYPLLKTLSNVHHLVADIEGKLTTTDFSKIVTALFPGGSITGCPKIRACQIIEELEQKGRGPYTGSFGYITGHKKIDLNILIRTVFIENNQLTFNVGGGITLMSNPEEEFLETQHKARNILQALNAKE
ncbi:MAG: anthranilate synthase component I family protein [Salinivirgaceae bacterium]|jgi:para-aminobenzoate synthetase component 1|nr:anthranilate synthase component I family protein [Salinivirgaceae bacterium]